MPERISTVLVLAHPPSDYSYSALTNADIRILQIVPSTMESSPLHVRLMHMPLILARAKSYTALSYAWGDDASTQEIFIDEKRSEIRINLAQILGRMRTLGYEYVWVCLTPIMKFLLGNYVEKKC